MQIKLALFWFCNCAKPTIPQSLCSDLCSLWPHQSLSLTFHLTLFSCNHISFTVMYFLLLSTTQTLTEITFHLQKVGNKCWRDEVILTHTEGSSQQDDNTPYHLHTRHRRHVNQVQSNMLSQDGPCWVYVQFLQVVSTSEQSDHLLLQSKNKTRSVCLLQQLVASRYVLSNTPWPGFLCQHQHKHWTFNFPSIFFRLK